MTSRTKRSGALVSLLAAGGLAVAGCSSASSHSAASATGGDSPTLTTPAATKNVGAVTWDLFYEPTSIDPAHSANYAENEVVANLCDSLLRQNPDFSISSGLAASANPDPTTWVYTIHPGVTFWDGHPVTAADVAYSLNRNLDQSVGSFFVNYYRHVASITATGPLTVTVKLTQPDSLFNQSMSTAAGAVVEKAYAVAKGSALGSPTGGVMCSGPFAFSSWTAGSDLLVKRYDGYWDPALRPKAAEIDFKFVGSTATETNSLLTDQLDGMYQAPIDSVAQLAASSTGKLYRGAGLVQTDLLVNKTDGPLADPRIRRALSEALDRTAIASSLYQGTASPALRLVTPAAYGSGATKTVYEGASTPISAKADLAAAQKLVKEAGSPTAAVTYAYPAGGSNAVDQFANYLQQTGKQIGLNIQLKPIAPQTYANIFFDPTVRKGVDLFYSLWYPDFADAYDVYANFRGGASIYNYFGYDNATANTALDAASQAYDPVQRAKDVVTAETQVLKDLPWIPVVNMDNLLYMNSKVTGAPASFVELYYPWAAKLGGA
jgi:peptide/nickel transport system substrate-binding protein